jgi:phosphoribosylanthranilate isomerase
MMVKVCGITRREDALVAAEAGASAIGFIFYPGSPRYIAPERAAALGEGLDLWRVGIFVDETPAAIDAAVRPRIWMSRRFRGGAPDGARVWKASGRRFV